MSLVRQLVRGVRSLIHRRDADRDIADEVQHYVDQATAAHVARGLAPDAAHRAAQLEIGNSTVMREQMRGYGWENVVNTAIGDLRFAKRRLLHTPGFTIVALLTLALGIGASAAIFSVVNPILFESLPYPHAKRIVTISDVSNDGSRADVTFGTYRELVQRSRSFDAIAVMRPWEPALTDVGQPEQLEGQRVTADYFRALGVAPAIGQNFDAAADRLNGPSVVILSDGLWRRRFGADPSIVGRQITLGGGSYGVIGVMPRGFENVLAPSADVWSLLQYDASLPTQGREWGHHLRMVARVRDGVGVEQSRRELSAIARQPAAEFPRVRWASLERGLIVNPLQDDVTRGVKQVLVAVIGAVLLLLAIACVNVTNLLLARGAQRRGELAMRAALGADRSRLVRQLLTESLLLASIGGALGLVVAKVGVRALVALSPAGLPRLSAVTLDLSVLAFALVLTTIIGVVVGLIPALHASRGDLQPGVAQTSRRAAGRHRTTRGLLVVTEVALALVLLVGSGLLFRSLRQVLSVSLGFTTSHILAMQVKIAGPRYAADSNANRFYDEALAAARLVPGVSEAAFVSQVPLGGGEDVYGVHFESSPTGPETEQGAFRYAVSPKYFQVMGISLLRGRWLDERDVAGAGPSVLLSESLARAKFPGQNPLGQRLRIGGDTEWSTIVGVVGDVKQTSLALSRPDAVYIIDKQQTSFADRSRWIVVRTNGDAASLSAPLATAVWSVDKNQPIVRVATMESLVTASVADRRFALIVFEAFAIAALVLAAAGIYGVLSGSVTERTREIGVRAALGATPSRIVGLVLRNGLGLTMLGVAIGLAIAAVATRALTTMLFGITRFDALTYVEVVALLCGVSVIACAIPAWRATRIDPAGSLRSQ
ncbi:MAG TPA: ABC transporter permease [Gemmatimonadaceae bacterium]